jgi:hypothetical protein
LAFGVEDDHTVLLGGDRDGGRGVCFRHAGLRERSA